MAGLSPLPNGARATQITRNVPLYQLCFFSKNDAGYRLWDNVSGIDEKGQRWLGTG